MTVPAWQQMERRYFLTSITAGSAMLLLPVGVVSCASKGMELQLAVPRSLMPICNSETLLEIGRVYLKMFPEENEIEVLSALISRELSINSNKFFEDLAAKITEEFKNRQFVEVGGWLLSRTEARQCALYSLLNS
jgi:hypothetical protein